eukprot:24760-Hanusia_phi.AAC.1
MKSLAKISGEEESSRELEEVNRHVRAIVEAVSRLQKHPPAPAPAPPVQPHSMPAALRPRDVIIPPAARREGAKERSQAQAPPSARSSKATAGPSSAAGVGLLEEVVQAPVSQPKSEKRREQMGWVRVRVGRKAWKRMYAMRNRENLCLHREET